ncbi:hypothetical protein BDY21DRAFT_91737 [Lineolata rhizophorae]|uniref:Uncharacterized protein n=1 Tax=Lineolata rhizophorae TaxID=578093 RepID=A0A6A6PCG5_9PEZI|nr:hypothetical protein BDY21DRAFT_91737 [Lineolata rhizophorae]
MTMPTPRPARQGPASLGWEPRVCAARQASRHHPHVTGPSWYHFQHARSGIPSAYSCLTLLGFSPPSVIQCDLTASCVAHTDPVSAGTQMSTAPALNRGRRAILRLVYNNGTTESCHGRTLTTSSAHGLVGASGEEKVCGRVSAGSRIARLAQRGGKEKKMRQRLVGRRRMRARREASVRPSIICLERASGRH